MSSKKTKADFNKIMEELKLLGQEKPLKARQEGYYSLQKMGKVKIEGYNKFLYNLPLVFSLIIVIVNIITCIKIPEQIMFSVVGIIFFLVGYNFALRENAIIFLFSHGLIGFGLMNGYCLKYIFTNPIMTDNPLKIILLIVVAALLLIGSLIYGTIYSFSNYLKANPVNKSVPLALAGLSTIILQIMTIYLEFNINLM